MYAIRSYYAQAQVHFERALALNDRQLNAYYGLAISREKQGDRDSALGAMRVYVHLAEADDPYLRKAWAAIWEWEAARNIKIKTASPCVITSYSIHYTKLYDMRRKKVCVP